MCFFKNFTKWSQQHIHKSFLCIISDLKSHFSRPDFFTSCSDSLFSRSCVGLRLSSGILRRPRISFSHCSRPLLTLSRSLASSTALGSSGALLTVAEEEQSRVFFILQRPNLNQTLMNTLMTLCSFFSSLLCFYLVFFLFHFRALSGPIECLLPAFACLDCYSLYYKLFPIVVSDL